MSTVQRASLAHTEALVMAVLDEFARRQTRLKVFVRNFRDRGCCCCTEMHLVRVLVAFVISRAKTAVAIIAKLNV